jgi:RecB family endonuclease NucS
MPIFELTENELRKIEETSFSAAGTRERADLQRLLQKQVEIIAPDTLIIAEEFGEWDDSRRRIDLLGVDKNANLVVFELKRTDDGGHMELQALRYAAMISTMTFDKAVEVYSEYLRKRGNGNDAAQELLQFLEWDENDNEKFAQDVRVVLVSAEFSKEITTTVLWLNDYGLDIRCVRIKPYNDNGRTLVDIEQVIPLPEASQYQVSVSAKNRQERILRIQNRDLTKYDVAIFGNLEKHLAKRSAIFFVVKSLCNSGVSPERINELIHWKGNLFLQADGTHDSNAFIQMIIKQGEARGRKIDYPRWYCDDEELIHFAGKTYAFDKMWGNRWGAAMNLLKDNFPDAKIDFWASKETIEK